MSRSPERRAGDAPPERFPEPPFRFTDGEGREIEVRACREGDLEPLLAMYLSFHPGDRAQGIPPRRPDQARDWLEGLVGDGHNVLAWEGDTVVGHGALVPDPREGRGSELVIFVARDHQRAGIGTRLLHGLLGLGAARGARKVWLCVERWNSVAVHLYRKAGFETRASRSFELEMELELG